MTPCKGYVVSSVRVCGHPRSRSYELTPRSKLSTMPFGNLSKVGSRIDGGYRILTIFTKCLVYDNIYDEHHIQHIIWDEPGSLQLAEVQFRNQSLNEFTIYSRKRFQQKQQRATRTPGEITGKIWKIHECCDSDETGNTAECQKTTFGFVWQNEAEILPTQCKMQFLQCWRRGRTRQVIYEKNIIKG